MVFKRLKSHQCVMVQRTSVSSRTLMSGIEVQITLNRTHLMCGVWVRHLRHTNYERLAL